MSDTPASLEELDKAYRMTDFWVDGPKGRFAIRIGQICAPLDELLTSAQASAWAYITAYNPGSQRPTNDQNAERMRELERAVAGSYVFYRGEGIGRIGNWPPEPSLLILGIDEASARQLACRFGQNAFVYGDVGEPARLIWT